MILPFLYDSISIPGQLKITLMKFTGLRRRRGILDMSKNPYFAKPQSLYQAREVFRLTTYNGSKQIDIKD